MASFLDNVLDDGGGAGGGGGGDLHGAKDVRDSMHDDEKKRTQEPDSSFEKDALFHEFASADYDESQYIGRVVSSASQFLVRLTRSIRVIDEQIHKQVVSRHSDLLNQSTYIQTIETDLLRVRARIDTLRATVMKLTKSVIVPYEELADRSLQLENVQRTGSYLNSVLRFMRLHQQLNSHMRGSKKNITKAAQCISDIETILREVDLSSIEAVDAKLPSLQRLSVQLREEGRRYLFEDGMDRVNHGDIAAALQIFFNLSEDELSTVVRQAVQRVERRIVGELRGATDASTLGASAGSGPSSMSRSSTGAALPGVIRGADVPPVGSSSSWRTSLWTRLETFTSAFLASILQVWSLQQVLRQYRDPHSQIAFIDALPESERTVFRNFWISITSLLAKEFSISAKRAPFIRNVFTSEYPRFLVHFTDFFQRVENATKFGKSGSTSSKEPDSLTAKQLGVAGEKDCALLTKSLAVFEDGYLNRSLSKLNDPVNLMFGRDDRSIPTLSDISLLISAIKSELQAVTRVLTLQPLVLKGVLKSIHLLAGKLEALVDLATVSKLLFADSATLDGELSNVSESGVSNGADARPRGVDEVLQRNADICNLATKLEDFFVQYAASLDLDSRSSEVLTSCRKALSDLARHITWGTLHISLKHVEGALLKMHEGSFGWKSKSKPRTLSSAGSPFMRDFKSRIDQVCQTVLILFKPCPALVTSTRKFINYLISSFVNHCSLVTPLSQDGALALAGDMAKFQEVLIGVAQQSHIYEKRDFDEMFQTLSELKRVLFVADAELIDRTFEPKSLSTAQILQHLLRNASGILPSTDDIPAPFILCGHSIEQFMKLTRENTEQQHVKLLQTAYTELQDLATGLLDLGQEELRMNKAKKSGFTADDLKKRERFADYVRSLSPCFSEANVK